MTPPEDLAQKWRQKILDEFNKDFNRSLIDVEGKMNLNVVVESKNIPIVGDVQELGIWKRKGWPVRFRPETVGQELVAFLISHASEPASRAANARLVTFFTEKQFRVHTDGEKIIAKDLGGIKKTDGAGW